MNAWRGFLWLAGSVLILPVKGYQWLIRPLLPARPARPSAPNAEWPAPRTEPPPPPREREMSS